MPSARFKLVVALMGALTVGTYAAEPFLVASGGEPRKPAPDFTLATIDGSTFSLSLQGNGTVVLLDFMATWCFPCRDQLATLAGLRLTFPAAMLTMVSIDEEYSIEPARVAEFRETYARTGGSAEAQSWYFAADTVGEHVGLKYGVNALPTVVLIDRAGGIARTWYGAVTGATLEIAIEAELRA
jgi:peroxiredoxin